MIIVSRIVPLSLLVVVALAVATTMSANTLTVRTLEDVDLGNDRCSLREAIVAANTDAFYQDCPPGDGADVIELVVAGTVNLTGDLPEITDALTVRGLGVGSSAIDGGGVFELFHFTGSSVGAGEILRLEDLQLTGGFASEGGAVYVGSNRALEISHCDLFDNQAVLNGGAVNAENAVSVEIENCWFDGNVAGAAGGALATLSGEHRIADSTFSGNVAQSSNGGALYALNVVDVELLRSTLSENSAARDGGGLSAVGSGGGTRVRLDSVTVVGNAADWDGNDDGDGGGFSVAGGFTLAVINAIVADNSDASSPGSACPDVYRKLGASILSQGFNLVGAHECVESEFPLGMPNQNGDLVGDVQTPVLPLLETLAPFGGPTPTRPPLPGSPVIDQGSCPGAPFDQRGFGFPRSGRRVFDYDSIPNLGDGCDIGAIEVGTVSIATPLFADGFESGDTSRWSSELP